MKLDTLLKKLQALKDEHGGGMSIHVAASAPYATEELQLVSTQPSYAMAILVGERRARYVKSPK